MKIQLILIFAVLLFSSTKCRKIAMDFDYPLYLNNKSNLDVIVYLNDDSLFKSVYPDTQITNFKNRLSEIIVSNSIKVISGGSATWSSIFDVSVPNDTLSIFVLESENVHNYSWDSIRSQYIILQRYDLSLKDLENRNFEIEFPYDSNKGKLKVWKP